MLTLRCTPGLRASLRLPDPLPEPPPSGGALGDWFVHRVEILGEPLIVATSQASLLTLLLPATLLRARLAQVLPAALGELLARLAVPAAMVARELATMEPVLFGPARDRRVLESMSQLTSEAQICLGQGHGRQSTAHLLAYVPRPALDMKPPVERLAEIFGVPALHRTGPA
jgi:hypothetical protein